jgi:NAD-dependent SIR2 family protein deacetylase
MINLVIMAKCLNSICAVSHAVTGTFLQGILATPARKALAKENIDSLEKLSEYSEKEILQLHGFGKSTIHKLKAYMQENNVSFKN